MRKLKLLIVAGALAGLSLGSAAAFTGPAHASDYSGAQYQVTFSLNCNNPSAPCQQVFGLGGIWGWIALMPDGTGTAQVPIAATPWVAAARGQLTRSTSRSTQPGRPSHPRHRLAR